MSEVVTFVGDRKGSRNRRGDLLWLTELEVLALKSDASEHNSSPSLGLRWTRRISEAMEDSVSHFYTCC